jgi:hypothetical protein
MLMYLTFIFYLPEDGHMVGWNMQEFTVYINQFRHTCVHLYVPLLYIFE